MQIDIISDLHEDSWNPTLKLKYPCGTFYDKPYEFNNINSKYLIIAGDIADKLDYAIDFLNHASQFYDKVFFIDGNHEHVEEYPNLYSLSTIKNYIFNNKIIFLPFNEHKINDTLFIGVNGWWDYLNNDENEIKKCEKYLTLWNSSFDINDGKTYINSIIDRANKEYKQLLNQLNLYENDKTVKNIVIVTHTIPLKKFGYNNPNDETDGLNTAYNSKFENLFKFKKISHWIFGHTHVEWNEIFFFY